MGTNRKKNNINLTFDLDDLDLSKMNDLGEVGEQTEKKNKFDL